MGTMLPCNRLADTFDVDMPSCIICSSCGNELSKTLFEMKKFVKCHRGCTVRRNMMSACMKSKHPKQNFKSMIKILRYIIPAIVEREVGLANLEAEFCKPTLLEEITAPVYI